MRILMLELSGCTRLMLNNLNHIRITFTEQIQLILGTNGSGKSSLLSYLTPLPADKNEFTKEGYKLIEIEHKSTIYVLRSSFSPTTFHSFIKDGLEQNPGGTASVFKELVKRTFGITQDIQECLIGNTHFTDMGPGERRNWFQMLSSVDYTYAIGVYQRLKERLRDVQGAYKLSQSRLVQESAKLLTKEQADSLSKEVADLNEFLDHLLTVKPKLRGTDVITPNNVKQSLDNITRLSRLLIKTRNQFKNFEQFTGMIDIDAAIINVSVKYQSLLQDEQLISTDIESAITTLKMFAKTQTTELSDVSGKIAEVELVIANIKSSIQLPINYNDPVLMSDAFNSVLDTLTSTFAVLPVNPGNGSKYSRASLESLRTILSRQQLDQSAILNREADLLRIKKDQEHYKSHDALTCPECNHKWHQGFNQRTYDEVVLELVNVSALVATSRSVVKETEQSIAELMEYMSTYRIFSDTAKAVPILKELWDYILRSEALFANPPGLIYTLNRFKTDLSMSLELKRHTEQLAELYSLKELQTSESFLAISDLEQSISTNQTKLYETNRLITDCRYSMDKLTSYKTLIASIGTLADQLNSAIILHDEKETSYIDQIASNAYAEIIRSVQLTKTNKVMRLNEVSIQQALVDQLQDQINDLDNKQISLKLLTKALSPTDGLIAKGMLGFINTFIKQMNAVIKKIWLYPLVIEPCHQDASDDVELDYKFPVKVNGAKPISDVAKGSTAMKEVIDLAFRLTAMKYLDLNEAPVVLDEFGKTFDHAHRGMAFKTAIELLTQQSFSQLFIVSHYSDMYGSLSNSEVCVLCANNIVIPANCKYNEHIVMK